MKFDYQSYKQLLCKLMGQNYEFCSYHNYADFEKCVILRHDIDSSLQKAEELANLEAKLGVSSTYFVLLTGSFYNPASASSLNSIKKIQQLGHEIGLHFDELAYKGISTSDCIAKILTEKNILSEILGMQIRAVSMHRPSKATLEANLQIPGMVNSYSKTFFNDFKYLSDSRRRYREPIDDIIESKKYSRLHILTHAFWYHETEESIEKTVSDFIKSANAERYNNLNENITDLASIVKKEDII